MFRTRFYPAVSCVLLLLIPVAAYGAGTQAGTVSITATVAEFFEWPTMTITQANFAPAGSFNGVSQTKTATLAITANTNVAAGITIQPSDGGDAKGAVLTEVGGKILTTTYNLTGDLTANGDNGVFITAAAFITNPHTYAITAGTGAKNLSLQVKAVTDANASNAPAGNYTCLVTLTAAW